MFAAGISLIPGTAHATGPATSDGNGVSQPDLTQAEAADSTTFTSPAKNSVRQTLPTAQSKLSAAPQTEGTAADANPTLAVALSAFTVTAHGLELDSSITSATTPLEVSVAWGDGATTAATAGGTEIVTSQHAYAELGTYTVKVTVTDKAAGASVTNEVQVTTEGSDYTPYGPTRLLDTRNGTGAAKAKVAPYSSAHVKVGGNGGIPAGVTAVVLNVTVTNTTSGGHVTAFADGDDKPTTSNVNFAPGQTVPNLVIVPVGANGYVNLYNGGWESVDLIADVTGYFTQTASSGYTPLPPERFVDTRSGLGTAKGQVAGQASFGVQIAGKGQVPASGVTAVALNVTVTNPKEAGHLTVYPGGQQAPTASNLNFTAGQTIANSVIVPVGPDGKINVRNGAWAGVDVIVDVVGYYSPASKASYLPFAPMRFIDTRDAAMWDGPLGGRDYIYLPIAPGEPGVTGFVLNTTVTNTKDTGYLAVTPDPNSMEQYDSDTASWPTPPTSSTLNWTTGKTVPNLVQASTGEHGIIDFWNQSDGNLDLIVDVFGVYEDN